MPDHLDTPLPTCLRSAVMAAIEIARRHEPARGGVVYNLGVLAAWLDGHPRPADTVSGFYPAVMTPALAEVLGQPNFRLRPIWMALREVGAEIKPRYEDEVAAALHFLIPFALAHGGDWRRHAADRLAAMKADREARSAG